METAKLIEELKLIADALELGLYDGVVTGTFKGNRAVLSVKTSLPSFQASFSNNGFLLLEVIKSFKSKWLSISYNAESSSIVFKRKQRRIEIYVLSYHLEHLNNLYSIDVDWQKCPYDFFHGISAVLNLCEPAENFNIISMDFLHCAGRYVGATDNNIISRYRLSSEQPFDLMLNPKDIRSILSKINNLKVLRIGRCKHNEINGVIFDFGYSRLFLPEIKADELARNALEGTIIGFKPDNKEARSMLNDCLKARDHIPMVYCKNMMPAINNMFKIIFQMLIELNAEVIRQLRFFSLSYCIKITVSGHFLLVESIDERFNIKKRFGVRVFGKTDNPINITIKTTKFLDSIKGRGCLLGFNNKGLLYIKKKQLEIILQGD